MAKDGFKSITLVVPLAEWREIQLRAAKTKVSLNNYIRQQVFPEVVIEEVKDSRKTIKVKEDAKAKSNHNAPSN